MSLDYGITMTTNPRWESQPTAKWRRQTWLTWSTKTLKIILKSCQSTFWPLNWKEVITIIAIITWQNYGSTRKLWHLFAKSFYKNRIQKTCSKYPHSRITFLLSFLYVKVSEMSEPFYKGTKSAFCASRCQKWTNLFTKVQSLVQMSSLVSITLTILIVKLSRGAYPTPV